MSAVLQQLKPIEINMLREETKQGGTSLWVAILALIALCGILVPAWLWIDAKQDASKADGLLAQVNANIAAMESKLNAAPQAAGADLLITLPDKLQQMEPQTTLMLGRLNDILPKEANIRTIAYSGGGHVQLTGTFASSEQIVTVMNELEKSDYFRFQAIGSMQNVWPKGGKSAPADQAAVEFIEPAIEAPAAQGSTEQLMPMSTVTIDFEYQPSSSTDGTGGSP